MDNLFASAGELETAKESTDINVGDRVRCSDDIVREVVFHTLGHKDIYVTDGRTIIKVPKSSVEKLNRR